jgi:hypothetical protein
MDDTDRVNHILEIVRMHFRQSYTGYDTYIDRDNLFEHVHELCKMNTLNSERLESIRRLTTE